MKVARAEEGIFAFGAVPARVETVDATGASFAGTDDVSVWP